MMTGMGLAVTRKMMEIARRASEISQEFASFFEDLRLQG
jgi:hypothetical protein